MNPVCLFTVIYPGCVPFLPRFFESVQDQTVDAFDLMILNDGVPNAERLIPIEPERVRLIPVSGTIAKIREYGLKLLYNSDFEKIIFADADDYLSAKRIEKAVNALEDTDMYVNDLTVVNRDEEVIEKRYFSNRLKNGYEISKEFILQKSIMGLGNSSVRKGVIRDIQIPDSVIAVDWIIFTDMILRGCSAIFKNDSETYYRQHEENTAGFKKISADRIWRALEVQMQNASYFAPVSIPHKKHLAKLLKLKSRLSGSEQNMKTYLTWLNQQLTDHPFWWEEIKTSHHPAI